jgi:hypothetical protein
MKEILSILYLNLFVNAFENPKCIIKQTQTKFVHKDLDALSYIIRETD